jgi:hypothetical protein
VKPLVPGMAPVAFGLGEEGPVSHRLNDDEHEVEQDDDGGEQDRLERGLARVGLGLGVVRDDEGEDGERAMTTRKARAPSRLYSCSQYRSAPMSSAMPTMPFRTIIRVANMASRASVGLFAPCSMMAASSETSMTITERVSTSVP